MQDKRDSGTPQRDASYVAGNKACVKGRLYTGH